MKVWMLCPKTNRGKSSLLRFVFAVLGIILLLFASAALVILRMEYSLPEWVNWLIMLAFVPFFILIMLRLIRRNNSAASFFAVKDDRIYYTNAAGLAAQYRSHGVGTVGKVLNWLSDTDEVIAQMRRKLEADPESVRFASEIVNVYSLKERAKNYAVRCRLKYPNGTARKTTLIIEKEYADIDGLISALMRLTLRSATAELEENRNPSSIAVSLILFLAALSGCVLSHPSFAVLNGRYYYPCMLAALVAFTVLLYYILRQRRGEN